MNQPSVLITGSNRGIGLKLVEQYAKKNFYVLATCRDISHADQLDSMAKQYSNIQILALDVAQSEDIQRLANTLKKQPIDILINNAGIWRSSSLNSVNKEAWLESFTTNAIAPYEIAQAFLPNILDGNLKKVVSITSKMGSIEDNTSGGSYIYRSSKSALNMVMRSLQHDLQSQGIATLTLHPGWVQTDMGGMNALINVDQSVVGMMEIIDNLTLENSGQFLDYAGKPIGW
ncbi:SDR family oxidoreductase [Methylophilaceae bacterium]|nr:SDR family oxidoreductase [Methylophilaceae bacterium]